MLEGNELEGKIGTDGSYVVDVDEKGMVKAQVAYGQEGLKGGAFIEMDIIVLLEQLAKKTKTGLDDTAIALVKKATGRA